MNRKIIPIKESFFNDGYWYVLGSTSMGGTNPTPNEISQKLISGDEEVMRDLLAKGACLPIYFPGDCALDNAVLVLGELDQREQDEWIGRLRAKLEIPCGEFMIMGGAMEEHFEESLYHFEAPNPDSTGFHKLQLEPGSYVVEIYAFLSSMTVNFAWEEPFDDGESVRDWWNRSRPGREAPKWIQMLEEEEYVDSEDLGLLEYIIRLVDSSDEISIPAIDSETKWVTEFEIRKPEPCPLGILRSELLRQL